MANPKGGPGRKKGSLGRITIEARELAQRLVTDPAYQKSLLARMKKGTAGAIEVTVWQYAYGAPKKAIEVSSPEGVVVTFGGRYRAPDETDDVPLPPGSYGTRGPF